jgi:hypothetical protein
MELGIFSDAATRCSQHGDIRVLFPLMTLRESFAYERGDSDG